MILNGTMRETISEKVEDGKHGKLFISKTNQKSISL